MKFYLFLAIIFSIFMPTAYAANWQQLSISDSERTIYVDESSLKQTSEDTKRAWFKNVFSKPSKIAGKKFDSNLTLTEFKCKAKKIRNIGYIYYLKGEPVVSNTTGVGLEGFNDVIPDSIGDFIHFYACADLLLIDPK